VNYGICSDVGGGRCLGQGAKRSVLSTGTPSTERWAGELPSRTVHQVRSALRSYPCHHVRKPRATTGAAVVCRHILAGVRRSGRPGAEPQGGVLDAPASCRLHAPCIIASRTPSPLDALEDRQPRSTIQRQYITAVVFRYPCLPLLPEPGRAALQTRSRAGPTFNGTKGGDGRQPKRVCPPVQWSQRS
jgi:hypothetical protein